MRTTTFVSAAGLVAIFVFSTNVFADAISAQMSAQMLLIKAPVPTAAQPKDLLFFADKPGDLIISTQKPSLVQLPLAQALISPTQVESVYRQKLGDAAVPLLKSGYKVFSNFIEGMKTVAPFATVQPTDEAELWQMFLPNTEVVNDTILQLEWFHSGLGGHAQIRFKLSDPILLVSQTNPAVMKFIDGDVVYALMALRTEHGSQTWDAVTGLTGAFASSYMMASTQHMANIQLSAEDGSLVDQYQLKLNPDQRRNLFSYALQVGTRAGEHEIYNLIYNSCIEATLRALKTVDQRVDQWEFNPYQVVPLLNKLGLIGPKLQSANDEFKSPMRQLETPENAKTLQVINTLLPVMNRSVFSESLRTLAAVIIEDHWTTLELNTLLANLASAQKGADVSALISSPVSSKSEASVRKLVGELSQVLEKNKIELPELMIYFAQASLTSR